MRNNDADMPMEHRIDGTGDAEQMADMPSEPQIEEANEPEPMSRRELLRLGLAGVSAFALTRLGLGQIRAEPKPVPCQRLIADLPPDFTQAFWTQVVGRDQRVGLIMSSLERDGFQFIQERIRAFSAVSSRSSPRPAGILSIAPSFKPFPPTAPSHDAWSIVSLYNGCIHTVFAAGVTVDHSTWQISRYTIREFDPSGNLYERSIPRDILREGPRAIVERLGLPRVDPQQWHKGFAAPDIDSAVQLSTALFREWINDRYAQPLYPPGAIPRLLNDAPLMEAVVQAQWMRYQLATRSTTKCCSSSSSCNACTSCSTSTFTVEIEIDW
jgi:hypothetical protein